MTHSHAAEHIDETAEWKNFSRPDEVREFPRGRVELINIGGATVGRAIFQPGWRWSTSVQPIAKTKIGVPAISPVPRFGGTRHTAALLSKSFPTGNLHALREGFGRKVRP